MRDNPVICLVIQFPFQFCAQDSPGLPSYFLALMFIKPFGAAAVAVVFQGLFPGVTAVPGSLVHPLHIASVQLPFPFADLSVKLLL